MSQLDNEVDQNGTSFSEDWQEELAKNISALGESESLKVSYRRLTAIQAVRSNLLRTIYSEEALAFLSEAQNDLLTSHVFAAMGAWRSALQALRSSIENTLCCHYYQDHPIEYALWNSGKFKIGFSSLKTYFTSHPAIEVSAVGKFALNQIVGEYGTLSKAVHASAPQFRMTDSASKILLWGSEIPKLKQWASRERKVVEAEVLIAFTLNHDRLTGTKLQNVRNVASYALSDKVREDLKKEDVYI